MKHSISRTPGFYRGLWKLSLPLVLQNLITFSLGLMDTFMVSQLGNQEMAAVTTAGAPAFLLMSIVFGAQSGLGVLVSQYWGKGDTRSINRAFGVSCIIGGGLNLLLAIIFAAFPVQVMDLLSNRHELSLLGAPYLRIVGFSYVFNMISSLYTSVQRHVENASFGMKLFGFSTVLNTFLNYLLIFGKFGCPALGVAGAAWATLLARIAECLICVVCAFRSRNVPLELLHFLRPGWGMARRFVKYASPVIVNETLWGLGTSMATVILGYTANSVEMLAANAVMGNLNRLFLVTCFGLGAATGVLVGKAVGEGQRHEAIMDLSQVLLRFATLVGAAIAVVTVLLIPIFFRPVVFPMFKLYGESAAIATAMAVVNFGTIPVQAYAISAITGVLRCGGDVFWSTVLDIAPQWLIGLPLMAFFALILGGNIWLIALSMQMENLIKTPLSLLRVRSGKWIRDVTLPTPGKGDAL